MRILVVTTMYPFQELPSYGTFVAEQVRSLRQRGLDVDVLFLNTRKTRLIYLLGLWQVAAAMRSRPYDLIHTHHTYSFLLVDAVRKIVGMRIPVILTNHEGESLDERRITRTWHPTSRLRHSLHLKRLAAARADFVIFVSRGLSKAIPTSRPQAIIPCGVDLHKFAPANCDESRHVLGIPHGVPVLFFPPSPTGRGKRFELAKAAFDIVRRHRTDALLLTGGRIPHSRMPLYYNAADVVVQASFYEASPTVLKEALACEVPVVSTDSGDTAEVIEGMPNCFVCTDNPVEMAERILTCFGQRARGARGVLLAKGLSLEQTAERLAEKYRQIAGRGSLDACIGYP